MTDRFLEGSYVCLCKDGEDLCGDFLTTIQGNGKQTAVLSDGLGSGVKANILATLTGRILCTLTQSDIDIEEAIATMAATLPVCSERGLAYSTFSLFQALQSGECYLAQFDNPPAILLREGKPVNLTRPCRIINGKQISEDSFRMIPGDVLILLSDGVTSAGMDGIIPGGWKIEGVLDLLKAVYTPDISAKALASSIISACRDLYINGVKDDCSVAVYKMRPRQVVNMMIGPPQNAGDDSRVLKLFMSKDGLRVVCGGTTSTLVSRFVGKQLIVSKDYPDPSVPATAHIDGIDLVTEGVITLEKTIEIARKYVSSDPLPFDLSHKQDGASLLGHMLFDRATDINIFVGQAVNRAHEGMSINSGKKLKLIDELEQLLLKMGKKVNISYC